MKLNCALFCLVTVIIYCKISTHDINSIIKKRLTALIRYKVVVFFVFFINMTFDTLNRGRTVFVYMEILQYIITVTKQK
jgi:hypothetical protein